MTSLSPATELWSEVKVAKEELKIEVKSKVKEKEKMDKSNISSGKEGRLEQNGSSCSDYCDWKENKQTGDSTG